MTTHYALSETHRHNQVLLPYIHIYYFLLTHKCHGEFYVWLSGAPQPGNSRKSCASLVAAIFVPSISQMTLPRGPGSTRHGRGMVYGSGKLARFWKYALTGTGQNSSGGNMGCVSCQRGSGRRRRRSKRPRIVRLGRKIMRGRGMTRTRSVTVTMPSGKSVTRSRGYSRHLGPQSM